MKLKVEGDGYAHSYTAGNTPQGWCFTNSCGGYFTPGLNRPMYYDTCDELCDAVFQPRRKLVPPIHCSGEYVTRLHGQVRLYFLKEKE